MGKPSTDTLLLSSGPVEISAKCMDKPSTDLTGDGHPSLLPSMDLRLGKLAIKKEAAGKVRVFAITDGWTQSLLSGLHDTIFEILSKIPQDGTWDQASPLTLLQSLLREKQDKSVYSYDLSAATDRLPIDVQVQVLSQLIGRDASESWKTLLVDRFWFVPSSIPSESRFIRYAVGQPMGALSS